MSDLSVLLALRPGVTGGQSSIGFMVDPSEGSLRAVTPNTNLSITCFWDTQVRLFSLLKESLLQKNILVIL